MAAGGPPILVSDGFESFSTEHQVILGVFLAGAVGMAVLGRRWRGRDTGTRFAVGFAWVIPVFTIPFQILQFLPDDYDRDTSLPLQICDLSWIVAVHALATRRAWSVALLYFWGLTLTVQAVVTPSLGQTFPDPRWFMFWGMHLLTVWAAVYLAALTGGPDWRGFRMTVAVTAVWAAVVMSFNGLADTNYGYLNGKPDSASLLDLLGPWPAYVVAEVAILVVVWAAMTWPWVRGRVNSRPRS